MGSIFIDCHTNRYLRLLIEGVKDFGYGRELSEFGIDRFVNVNPYWQK